MITKDKLYLGKSVCVLDKYFNDRMYMGIVVYVEDNDCGTFVYVQILEPDDYYSNNKTDPRFPNYYNDIYPIASDQIYDAEEISEYESM